MKTKYVWIVFGPLSVVPTVWAERARAVDELESFESDGCRFTRLAVPATATHVMYYPESFERPGVPFQLAINYGG